MLKLKSCLFRPAVIAGAIACISLGSVGMTTRTQIEYQPTQMSSVDEAANTINALRDSFVDGRDAHVESVFASSTLVNIHTDVHYTQQNSQWVPTWGGSIVGGALHPLQRRLNADDAE
jgi:hypothetical protein